MKGSDAGRKDIIIGCGVFGRDAGIFTLSLIYLLCAVFALTYYLFFCPVARAVWLLVLALAGVVLFCL